MLPVFYGVFFLSDCTDPFGIYIKTDATVDAANTVPPRGKSFKIH